MTLSDRLEKPVTVEDVAGRWGGRKGDRLLPVLVVERGWEKPCVDGGGVGDCGVGCVGGVWILGAGGWGGGSECVSGGWADDRGALFAAVGFLAHPFSFVGSMFIRVDNGSGIIRSYIRLGLPLLYAMVFWIFGAGKGVTLAFLVSPIGAVIAVLGMFYLARLVAGPFAAAMAAILLGTSQIMLAYADNPNSHASCVACGVWGMFFLVRWWQSGGWWRGALAGFLLGYACLIRYSEGLLIVPIVVAVLFRMRWGEWRSYFRNAVPVLMWGVVVGALLYFNKHNMGTWTGYDSTNESEFGEAFTWGKLSTTWEQMLRTLYDTGLFFVFPVGVAGLGMLVRKNVGVGLMVLAWFVPVGVALYTSYYFCRRMRGWGGVRGFF